MAISAKLTHWPLENMQFISVIFTDTLAIEISSIDYTAGENDQSINQSINQSNPVLLKEQVRIPRTHRAGGTAMLWGRLPLDGVGSCRLFFTDDLHDNLSWVPASDKPHTVETPYNTIPYVSVLLNT